MKTAIIYYSKHHENTKKLLEAIQRESEDEITLIEASQAPVELESYDRIGFASGIYYSKFDKRVLDYAKKCTPNGKDVFFIYTCGSEKEGYTKSIREALQGKNANVLGEYGCLGLDTFGPFKLIGGIAKDHPSPEDVKQAVSFYQNLGN